MQKIWIITKRELASYFDSLMAYLMILIFLGICGSLTWILFSNIFVNGQASLDVFFKFGAFWSLFLFIPAITMRSIAEETRSGTIELLSTKAISDWQIVLGKFSAAFVLVLICIVCTLPYYVTVSQLGNVDDGAVLGGYLGLLLLSAAYISLGILASSLTQNQIVAFLVAIVVEILFHFMFGMMASSFGGVVGDVLNFLSVNEHFESISRGVIDSGDVIFFGSIIVLCLYLSQMMLSKRNWQS